MPGQQQVAADLSSYVTTLQTRIHAIENKFDVIYPNSGTTFAPGGDIDLANHDLLNAGEVKTKGQSICVDQYSSYNDVTVASTVAETSIVPQSNMLGDLVFPAGQPLGMAVRIRGYLALTSVAGDSFTIRIKTQGATLYSDVLTVAALSVNVPVCFDATVVVRAATASANATTIFGTTCRAILASGAYNPAIENTIDVTVQWGAALNTCVVSQMLVTTHFRDGA